MQITEHRLKGLLFSALLYQIFECGVYFFFRLPLDEFMDLQFILYLNTV